ncbi:MAG: hypothetical protein ACYCO3_08975 [Mycobacteriales bacterium]
MVTVGVDSERVEDDLVSGRLTCPDCSAVLHPWGHARVRVLRERVGVRRLRPQRAICSGYGRSHVLLPVSLLLRRADPVGG